jgi:hypothetical protein
MAASPFKIARSSYRLYRSLETRSNRARNDEPSSPEHYSGTKRAMRNNANRAGIKRTRQNTRAAKREASTRNERCSSPKADPGNFVELRGDYRRTAVHEFSVCLSYRLAQSRPATTCCGGPAVSEGRKPLRGSRLRAEARAALPAARALHARMLSRTVLAVARTAGRKSEDPRSFSLSFSLSLSVCTELAR